VNAIAKVWWLLALAGIADLAHAAINLLFLNPSVGLRTFAAPDAVWDMGMLALVAGACAVAAGVWSTGKNGTWLLALHGLALAAFGAIAVSPLVKGPLSFRPISLVFLVTAASLAAFAWNLGRRPIAWMAFAFAVSFPVVGFLVRLAPPWAFFVWMSSYLAFCAVFLLWLAFRARGVVLSSSLTA